jgi:hypothetical protein
MGAPYIYDIRHLWVNIVIVLFGFYLVKDRRKTASSCENGNGICVRKDKYSRFLGQIF